MRRSLSWLFVGCAVFCGGALPALAGPTGGPDEVYDLALAETTDVWRIRCHGREPTVIRLIGDDRADLDVFVYDSDGRLVAQDTAITSNVRLVVRPPYTQVYRIEVRNIGRRASAYFLRVE